MTETVHDAEIVEEHPAVPAVIEPTMPAQVEYVARVTMTPEAVVEQAEALAEITRAVLKPGVHYGVIPGTHGKPSLFKPGAEWLLKVYGLGHHFTQEEKERRGDDNYGVTYRCHITKVLADGNIVEVATCDGYCGRDEGKWAKAPWNTVIKMAQKRALVGACLQATGTSGHFTQDIEDYDRVEPGEAMVTERRGPTHPPAEREASGPKPASEKQIKMVRARAFDAMKAHGFSKEDAMLPHGWQDSGLPTSTSDLLASQIDGALQLIEKAKEEGDWEKKRAPSE